MRSLSCSLADVVLADAILIHPLQLIPHTMIRKGRSVEKSTGTGNTKPFTTT